MSTATTVRAMQPADLPQVLAWRNDPGIRRHMLTQHEVTLEEHTRWFESASQDPTRRLLIVESQQRPIGFVQFTRVAPEAACDWGFYAAPGAPPGSGTKLGQAALAFAFSQLGVHKVCGQALAGNEGSMRLHRKLGFVQEGILREQERIGDAWHDLVCFGLLRQEWQAANRGPDA